MNESVVIRIINDLYTITDKKVIYKILIKIRTDVTKDSAGINLFYAHGGLKPLVQLIKKPNEKIIDTALSILGNCCTIEECAQQVVELGIIPALVLILRLIPNASIQCRTCRILGNLASYSNNAKKIQDNRVANALSSVFEDNNHIATLVTAIRLVCKLWKMEKFQVDAFRLGIIKKIMLIIVKFSRNENASSQTSVKTTQSDIENIKLNPRKRHREATRQMFNSMIQRMENIRSDVFDHEILNQMDKPAEDEFILPVGKDKFDLFSGILKCMQMVATNKTIQVAEQLLADGAGYRCLVFLSKGNSPFRLTALKILSSLAFNPPARYAIGCANAVAVASDLLQGQDLEKPPNSQEIKYCVNIICLLAGDSCNRAKIRHSGALKTLLIRFMETECQQERDMIMYGFTYFCYDQMSIHLLVREGLIGALIKRLSIELTDMKVDHVTFQDAEQSVSSKNKIRIEEIDKIVKRVKGYSSPLINRDPGSPSSSSGSNYANQGSPGSYYSYSPRSLSPTNYDYDSDIESGTYSPVCSDDENEQSSEKQEMKANEKKNELLYDEVKEESITSDIDVLLQTANDDVEDSNNIDDSLESNPAMNSKENSTINRILVLLRDMPLRVQHVPDLAKTESVNALLKACRLISNPSAYLYQILAYITQDTKNFVPLLQQDFVIQLYELRKPNYAHDNCQSCSEMENISKGVMDSMSSIAQSGYGRGELAHYLLTGEKEVQKRVAIITTFIIRDPKILYTLLVEHNALYIVMEIILNDRETLSEKACLGITALVANLCLLGEDRAISEIDTIDYDENEYLKMNVDNDVITFIVSVEERVEFNVNILKETSDVFNSMFTSDFKESKNREVHIKDISVAGIKYFINLIVLSSKDSLDVIPLAKTMESALEAYELSIKYMLPIIEKVVLSAIKELINEKSALAVFEWSIKHNNRDLLEISILYYLSSDISGRKKMKMFREADNSNYSSEWNQLILDTIVDKCLAAPETVVIHKDV